MNRWFQINLSNGFGCNMIGWVIDEIFVVKKPIFCPDVHLSILWFLASSLMAVPWVQKRPRMTSHSFTDDNETRALMPGYFLTRIIFDRWETYLSQHTINLRAISFVLELVLKLPVLSVLWNQPYSFSPVSSRRKNKFLRAEVFKIS